MTSSAVAVRESAPVPTTRRESRRARRWRLRLMPVIVAVLFLGGAATVIYPTAAAWINQYQQSQIIENMTDEVTELPRDGLAESLAAANEYNAMLTGEAVVGANQNLPTSDPDATSRLTYFDQLAANDGGLMARIKVPAIDLDLPVYHGTSDLVLLQGIGHLEGTSLPIGGASTHSVLTGHRGLASAELFTRLNEVVVGDTFTIEVFGEVLTYRVNEVQVVDPTETETLRPVRGEDLVTLVTCTPLGINSQRILVTGERITPTPIADIEAAGQEPEIPGFPWWALVLAGVVTVAAVYVGISGRGVPATPENTPNTHRSARLIRHRTHGQRAHTAPPVGRRGRRRRRPGLQARHV